MTTQQFLGFTLPLLTSLLVGSLITWGLQGILCVQVYNYFLSFPKDPIYMKTTVYSIICLELVQTAMVTHDTWLTFARGFGNMADLDELRLLWFTLPILGGLAGFMCHMTFAYRISLLSGTKVAGAIIAVPTAIASISAFVFGGKLCNAAIFSRAIQAKHIYLICGIWNGAGALCDVMIAVAMVYYLSRNSTGFRNTDLLITRIIRLTIETGMLTATASISSAVLFVGFREKLDVSVYFIIPAIMITKLYALTIVATFNNRPDAVGGPPPLPDIETYFDEGSKKYLRNTGDDTTSKEIRIGRTVEVWQDDMPMTGLKMSDKMYESCSQSTKDDAESSTGKV